MKSATIVIYILIGKYNNFIKLAESLILAMAIEAYLKT